MQRDHALATIVLAISFFCSIVLKNPVKIRLKFGINKTIWEIPKENMGLQALSQEEAVLHEAE